MKTMTYKVGGHLFRVSFVDECDDERLIPSCAPFRTEEQGDLLFHLTVDGSMLPEEETDEIGQFDCGGCNHGVYLRPDGGYRFDISDVHGVLCARFQTSADFSSCRVCLMQNSWVQRNYALNNSLMIAYAFAGATRHTLLMHSSVIRNGGKGYMFLGKSGTGKSTHTRLWRQHIPGSDLMNDDNPVLRLTDEGQVVVYGSPWSGKTPCYRNVEAPCGGIVLLEQRPENIITRKVGLQAFVSLLPSASTMKWDKQVYNGVCDTVAAVVGRVPFYVLGCLPDGDAARLSHSTLTTER
ncbi:MAG: hypothetical protein NC388_01245 [Clostridium sp.]|nr:hypothetical protein [Clostridium sp.]